MSQFQEEKVQRKFDTLRKKEEEESVKALAQQQKLSYADLSFFPIEVDAIKIIPEKEARETKIALFQVAGKHLKIAVRNSTAEKTQAVLQSLTEQGYTFDIFVVSDHSLERAWEYYEKIPLTYNTTSGIIEVSNEKLAGLKQQINSLAEIEKQIKATLNSRTTEALEIVLAGALALDASDIHIEPQEKSARLRFRLDGILHDVTFIPIKVYTLLLSRLKLISELKLNIHNRAQDGRFTIRIEGVDIEIRVSVLPGPYGENSVLRVLNPKSIRVDYEHLGMQPWVIEVMRQELERPNGMILTTGPTGSGKTTTLYAFLRKVHSPEIKIITIEDPIEYHLEGIEQTQVDQPGGYDFANGLRSIVRQDPDIILVGEIRDLETAETAMHAALTGHLVFSTLHTNSAAGTIPRLLDLGVKAAIIAPAINIAMGQRLLRRLCETCRAPFVLEPQAQKDLEKELAEIPSNIPQPAQNQWTIFKASGQDCKECNGIGYKSQIGIYELLSIDDTVEQLILKDPSEFELKKESSRQGQTTMRQDGLLKILAGKTDFEELARVLGTA